MSITIRHDSAGSHRGLSTNLWRAFTRNNVMSTGVYPGLGLFQFDDFEFVDSDRYTVTNATSGSFAVTEAEGEGGYAVADSGAAVADQGPNVQSNGFITPELGYVLAFEARLKATATGTPGNIFIGLSETDTTILAAGANTSDDFIGFEALADLGVTFASENGGTRQASSAVVHTLVDDTFVRLGFLMDSRGGLTPYVNGVAVPDGKLTTATSVPDSLMALSLAVHSEGTTQPTVVVDHWAAGKMKSYQPSS